MANDPVVDLRTCMVIDAQYSPYTGDDENADDDELKLYDNAVVLLLQDIETYNMYHCPLTPADIQTRAGISRELKPRELIAFAEAMRNRDAPVQLLVATDTNLVTPDLLDALEDRGMLQSDDAKKKYATAKANREKFSKEQEDISENEYEEFAAQQNDRLLKEFEEWKRAKQMESQTSPLLYMDDVGGMPRKENSQPVKRQNNIKKSNIRSPRRKR